MRTLDATEDDMPAILAIYNDAVRNTTAIWSEIEVDLADRLAWLHGCKEKCFPVIVAKNADGTVLGYASFGDWRPFDGYAQTVEHSVYVASNVRGQGVGSHLLAALIARARALGKHVMVAGVEASNVPSIQLHKSLGFHEAGRLIEVGNKFGTWLDLIFLQLLLDQSPKPDDAT